MLYFTPGGMAVEVRRALYGFCTQARQPASHTSPPDCQHVYTGSSRFPNSMPMVDRGRHVDLGSTLHTQGQKHAAAEGNDHQYLSHLMPAACDGSVHLRKWRLC